MACREDIEPDRLPGLVPLLSCYPPRFVGLLSVGSLRAFLVRLMMSSLSLSYSEREKVYASLILSYTSYWLLLCS